MRRPFIFITVILVTCGMIAVAHAVVYEALAAILATLFSINTPSFVIYLFVFLAVSFTAATFISMKYNNRAVRIFYIFSAGWTGFLIYFFFAAFLYGFLIILGVSSVIAAWLGLGLLAAALVTGIYGVVHGNTMQVSTVPLSLSSSGLPAAWKDRTAVWVSDIHLGQVRSASFAKKVTDKILSLRPDIVFIGGDLYDGSKVNEVEIVEPLRKLAATGADGHKNVPLGVYFVMGNHEEFDPAATARYARAIKDLGIRILDDEMLTIEGLQVIGVDHGRTEERARFISILEEIFTRSHFDPKRPSILLKHEPRDIDVAVRAGIHLQISGHTHQGQIFPVSLITKLTFKGFDYGLKKASEQTYVYTSSGVGTWGPPLRVWTTSEIVLFTFL